jgi:hypothetical protein
MQRGYRLSWRRWGAPPAVGGVLPERPREPGAAGASLLDTDEVGGCRLPRTAPGIARTIGFEMTTTVGTAVVRSTWIILVGDDIPRLTSCYVL